MSKLIAEMRTDGGNIYGYLAAASRAFHRAGRGAEWVQVQEEAENSGSYDDCIATLEKYVTFTWR